MRNITVEETSANLIYIEYYPEYIRNQDYDPEDVNTFLYKYFDCDIIKGDYGGEYWNYFCVRKPVL